MTALALTLVLVAAFLHATWNYCAKQAAGGLPFVYLVSLIICTCYIPVVTIYWLSRSAVISGTAILWIIGSGVIKTFYQLFLQRGYRTGDFSLIYPLARGTGPLLSTLGAIILLGERPSHLALGGGCVIIASIFWLTGGWSRVRSLLAPRIRSDFASDGKTTAQSILFSSFNYGLMSGVFIAAYTLWDRHGVATLVIAPLLYDAGTALTQLTLLTPFALCRKTEIIHHWHLHRRYAFGVALLSPVAYVLVLTAMSFTPVSYIAPAREVSIVIGAFIGAKVLKETDSHRRLWGAIAITLGVLALALG